MITSSTPNSFVLLEHVVAPVDRRAGEDEMEALARIILDRSIKGWEIVDVVGDEIRQTRIVFRKVRDPRIIPRYTMERLEPKEGLDELEAINLRLWQRLAENWIPACIVDSMISNPIIVYRKCYEPCSNKQIKLVTVPVSLFEHTATALTHELVSQQVKNNMTLACVVHGGLSPTLVLVTRDDNTTYQYAIDHAFGGVFRDQNNTLFNLIASRQGNGWEPCGMFEDSFISPCVIFRRAVDKLPIWTDIA